VALALDGHFSLLADAARGTDHFHSFPAVDWLIYAVLGKEMSLSAASNEDLCFQQNRQSFFYFI
jgi:hypothetical protein